MTEGRHSYSEIMHLIVCYETGSDGTELYCVTRIEYSDVKASDLLYSVQALFQKPRIGVVDSDNVLMIIIVTSNRLVETVTE